MPQESGLPAGSRSKAGVTPASTNAVPPRGLMFGLIAYGLWGMFPLYFPLLEPAGAIEILAHRMLWSLLISSIILTVVRGWRAIVTMPPRVWGLVVAAAILISVNWVIYIWAVNNGHVVEAALGYFINPLVSVVLGVLLFRERLRIPQWTAVGLGTGAVVVLAVAGGSFPWVALSLAFSFGFYGLVKKIIPLAPTASLTAEGLVQFVPALIYVVTITVAGTSTFASYGSGHVLLMASTGLVTCVPLLAFAAAAQAPAAVHPGPAAVPDPGAAVPARRPLVPRAHAGLSLGRVRAGVVRVDRLHRRRHAAGSPHLGGPARPLT